MKQIKVPSDVYLKNPETGEPMKIQIGAMLLECLSFKRAAFDLWLADERAGKDPVALKRWAAVLAKFSDAKSGDVIALEDQDYDKLSAIVAAPNFSYGVFAGAQLGSFSDAVLQASSA